jgi:hypothetical protein
MKHLRTALAIGMVGLLVVAIAAPALAATTTYRIAFRVSEFYEHDENGDGDSDDPGDYDVGAFVLKKGGERVGHLNFHCDVTELSPPRDLCWAAIRIMGKGQVIAAGSQAANSNRFLGAITGGTGAYRGASGVIRLHFNDSPTLIIETD